MHLNNNYSINIYRGARPYADAWKPSSELEPWTATIMKRQ